MFRTIVMTGLIAGTISGPSFAQQGEISNDQFLRMFGMVSCGNTVETMAVDARRNGNRIVNRSEDRISVDLNFDNSQPPRRFRLEMICETRMENGRLVINRRETLTAR